MQRQSAMTCWDGVVVLGILMILAATLYPVMIPRPVLFTRLPVPPMSFHGAELGTVMDALGRELRKQGRPSLNTNRLRYEPASLMHRRVTLETREEMPVREVFHLLEQRAGVRFRFSTCGTCRGPDGPIRIGDARSPSTPPQYERCSPRNLSPLKNGK